VDMTPEMVVLARENARKGGYTNVEFRLGEIEHLPVPDRSVDVILSNCVINLSPNKPDVYREAFRVLRPGGRLAISDVVATAEMPATVRDDLDLHCRCISGAARVEELERLLAEIGFQEVSVRVVAEVRDIVRKWEASGTLADYVAPASIEARKPRD
jgi:arsenite methyltransferase